jgi:fibronectin type 3 domain-containing protein
MPKVKILNGLGCLSFNWIDYKEGQIFDVTDKELKEIKDLVEVSNEKVETPKAPQVPKTPEAPKVETPKVETPKVEDQTTPPTKTEDEKEDEEIELDFAILEKMQRDELYAFIVEKLKNAWVEVKVEVNATKKEMLDALKAL